MAQNNHNGYTTKLLFFLPVLICFAVLFLFLFVLYYVYDINK